MHNTSNLRIQSVRPLLSPSILMEEIAITEAAATVVEQGRQGVRDILKGDDDRLVIVVGPCSIHDPKAALEYAQHLNEAAGKYSDDLLVVMRVYFEKPRTTVGWKGLINDPNLDGTFQINQGLRLARSLLRDFSSLGLPCGTEFLDPITPQFIADVVSWGAIGARTTESQTHRQLASGLSMPIGFKNGTYGTVQIAIDAILSSAHPHHFVGVTEQGLAGIVATKGNEDCHIILRGGTSGPNYDKASVEATVSAMRNAGLRPNVMVDCSHGNSDKNHNAQPKVAASLAAQIAEGQRALFGVMMESFLVAGNQKQVEGQPLTYGQSITDACMDWKTTSPLLEQLAKAVQARRRTRA